MPIATTNPATGETLRAFAPLGNADIDRKLELAAEAYRQYRRSAFPDRARMMGLAAAILEERKDEFARLMTLEMGKPLRSAVEEVVKCAWGCRYYAENAERFLADEAVDTGGQRSYVRYQPIGPVLAVMPWNFPFWQVFRFAAPSLMAGNVGLLKHASNVPQCALAIEDIFRLAEFPPGVFQSLLIGSDKVDRVLDDPRVAAATLTGSEPAGSHVAGRAGAHIKKTVLELGGSDPFIIMPSADYDQALRVAVKARIVNNGESCIAAKRFLVAESLADRFEHDFAREMAALKVGDPMDESTAIGPLATEAVLESLEEQVRRTIAAGARVLTGGHRLDRAGFYYAPTVLTAIPKDSPAASEELFGPVASVFRVRDLDEAICIANDTSFGLGCSVWTNDDRERARFIDEIETGMVFVNSMVVSDPRLPFGGAKRSGYGRELGVLGIREFVNIKTVRIF